METTKARGGKAVARKRAEAARLSEWQRREKLGEMVSAAAPAEAPTVPGARHREQRPGGRLVR